MKYRLLVILLALQQMASSQTIEKIQRLGKASWNLNEPAISSHPLYPDQVIVATNTDHVFYKKPGKKKFQHYRVESDFGVYGDPVLWYSHTGVCYFVHLARNKEKKWPDSFDRIVVQRSSDFGKTFDAGTGIGLNGKMHDKAWIYEDERSDSPYRNSIYISWTQFDKYGSRNQNDSSHIYISVQRKGSSEFSKPIRINDHGGDCVDSDSTLEGVTVTATRDGKLLAFWAGPAGLYMDESTDGGMHWGTDRVIATWSGGWNLNIPGFMRTNGLPFADCDFKGRIRVCTAAEIDGYAQILIHESVDKGDHWTLVPRFTPHPNAHYFMPHAWWDHHTGHYYLLYYELYQNQINVYLSWVLSGKGDYQTIQLNEKSFTVPGPYLFFGDYVNVCARGSQVHAVWTEVEKGKTVVKTARIRMNQNP